MKVRSKLSLAMAGGLLALLTVFYLGGRLVVVRTFRKAESEIVKAIPSLRETLKLELAQLDLVAVERAGRAEALAFLESGPSESGRRDFPTNGLSQLGIHLYLLAHADGSLAGVYLRNRRTGAPLPDSAATLAPHLAAGAPLLAVTNGDVAAVSGLIVLPEGPMLVVARAVRAAGAAGAPAGILTVGRFFQDPGVIARVAAVLPGIGAGPPEVDVRPPARRSWRPQERDDILHDMVEVAGLGRWDGERGIEIRLPLYDLYGRPALSLVVTVPRTFAGLAELALAWLTLLVAATGILFVVPLFMVQDRTVLGPLTHLADWLQGWRGNEMAGRRLRWRRNDEFGVMAQAVDRMLDDMEAVHQSIMESEQRTRAMLEANPDLFFVFDADGGILDCSTCRDSNQLLPTSAVAGRNIREVDGIQPEVVARLLDRLAATLKTGAIQIFEYSLRKPGGRMFWGEARVVRVREGRAMVIVRDITEQRLAEEERLRLEEKMQQVQKLESLGVLAGGIAHDFNNILAAVLGHTERAQSLLPPASPVTETVESIRRAAVRASGLTRQLLAYAGQGVLQSRLVDLNAMLRDMTQLLGATLSKKATLEVRLEENLPRVDGDSSQLWQVAMNLLTNASDALEDKPGRIELETRRVAMDEEGLCAYLALRQLRPGVYVQMVVRDTGCGIDVRSRERIFDPFYSTKAAGRGLGLSAVSGIVRAHRGGILVSSEVGAGTTFAVILPAVDGPDRPEPPAAREAREVAAAPARAPGGRLRLLLAEDEEDIRKLTVLVLNSLGYEVAVAVNGRQAVDQFRAQADGIDAVLMDVEMPELNGEEAVRAIRAMRADVPVVIMSGYGDAATRERFAPFRPAGYLSKPFSRDELVTVVAAAISSGGRAA